MHYLLQLSLKLTYPLSVLVQKEGCLLLEVRLAQIDTQIVEELNNLAFTHLDTLTSC